MRWFGWFREPELKPVMVDGTLITNPEQLKLHKLWLEQGGGTTRENDYGFS